MKIRLLSITLLGLACTMSLAQSSAEKAIYEKLTKGPDSVKAMETVLKMPHEYTAFVLYASAGVAYKEDRLEDSAFLYYIAQLRAQYDTECFPPKGKGGDRPSLFFSILAQHYGKTINPAVMNEPKVLAKTLARVKQWTPKAPKDYLPGYEFTKRITEKEAHEASKQERKGLIDRIEAFSTLLNDAEYFAAYRVVQSANSTVEADRPTKTAFEAATKTMKRIEEAKGLKGFFGK